MKKDELLKLGVAEDKAEAVLLAINAEIESVKEGVKNDPEFIQQIQSAEYAKNYSDFERVMKQKADVDLSQIDPELKGVKKIKAIADLVLKNIEETKDQTSKEWQDKAIQFKSELDKFKEEELPKALSEQKNQFYSRFNESAIKEESSKIETIGGQDLKIFAFKNYLAKNGLRQVWDESKNSFEVVTSEGNLKPTKDGKPLSKEELFKSAFEEAEILKKSNGTDPNIPGQRFNVPGVKTETQPTSHFEQMKQRMTVERG